MVPAPQFDAPPMPSPPHFPTPPAFPPPPPPASASTSAPWAPQPPPPLTGSWAPPPTAPPPPPIPPRARPDRYDRFRDDRGFATLVGALVVGIAYDAAARAGVATIATTGVVLVIAGLLLATGRVASGPGRVLVAAAPVFAASFTLRASPCVDRPVMAIIAILLLLGVSFARSSRWRSTFPESGGRLAIACAHLALAPGLLRGPDSQRRAGVSAADASGTGGPPFPSPRLVALARGAALALPVVVVIGGLLTAADPVFEAWVNPGRLVGHVVLGLVGAWLFVGLCRTTLAKRPAPILPAAPSLGTVEVVSVLGALTALYSVFVAAQLVAAFGGASQVLAHRGITYAQYAHRGFFQMLAAAAITALTLLNLRACADRTRVSIVALGEATILLTLGIVAVAVRRLALYEHAYGYTLLRLGCSVTAVWIGCVFVLLAIAFGRRHRTSDWLAPAILLSAAVLVGGWTAVNPAAVAVRSNARQAAHGQPFDVHAAMSLGPDAVPTLIDHLHDLSPAEQADVRRSLCNRPAARRVGPAFNRSVSRAHQAIHRLCTQSPG